MWQRTQFRWETVPDRGSHSHGALCCLMAVRTYGTTESPLEVEQRDCRPEQAEVRMKSSSRCNAEKTMPDKGGDPIESVSREQVNNVWHVITDVVILGDTTNHPISHPKKTI